MSDEEEDDFMSDKFLQQAAQTDAQMRQAIAKQAKSAVGLKKSSIQDKPVPIRVVEQTRRETGLATPISSDTKGFKMLMAMGYKPGQSVGSREGGLVEPIQLPEIKKEKTGLGGEDTETRKKREREEVSVINSAKRTKLEAVYKASIKSKFEEKKISGRLVELVKVCRQLDESKSISNNGFLTEFKEAESRPVEEGQPPVTLYSYVTNEMPLDDRISKLVLLIDYLRSDHLYCFFCGTAYQDQQDMDSHCPGPLEEDHE